MLNAVQKPREEQTLNDLLLANPLWNEAWNACWLSQEVDPDDTFGREMKLNSHCGRETEKAMKIAEELFAMGFETSEAREIREAVMSNAVVWIYG